MPSLALVTGISLGYLSEEGPLIGSLTHSAGQLPIANT